MSKNKSSQVFYGLPKKVMFCKKSLMSNQRPYSSVEFTQNISSKKNTLKFDNNGISESWKYSRLKKKINFFKREDELLKLLEKHRGKYGEFDCIVPGSGGKDSCYASHVLKYKYGMNPLTVTWPPVLYTSYGYQNFKQWLKTGKFTNISAKRNSDVMRLLTILAVKNLLHPFQTFILGQKNYPIKMALKYKIPLIFYGENEAEHGNAIADNNTSLRDKSYYTHSNLENIFLGGVKYNDLINRYSIKPKDLNYFLPADTKELYKSKIEVHYLGYYLKWIPQEVYYYSVENCGFIPRPFRTEGTYSKYNSIDDKIDDLHYYTTFIKFGIGRATYDVSQEIRNDHISAEEGKKLIKKYDGEYTSRYINDICDYLNMSVRDFNVHCDKFRSPHLWKKINKTWKLRHTCNFDGEDD